MWHPTLLMLNLNIQCSVDGDGSTGNIWIILEFVLT